MEENENKTTFNVNAEDVKKETEETVNQVKDTIKKHGNYLFIWTVG